MPPIEHEQSNEFGTATTPMFLQGTGQRLRESRDHAMRAAIPIGSHFGQESYPVLLPHDHWQNHIWIAGATRSGKTAKGVMRLAIERVRQRAWPEEYGVNPVHGPIVIGDLKGDDVLFHAIRLEAAKQGRKFYYYTNVRKFSTHLFNPLAQSSFDALSIPQVVQVVLNALNLWHGFEYGRGYFSAINRTILNRAMNDSVPGSRSGANVSESISDNASRIRTFPELRERIRTVTNNDRDLSSALELLTVIEDMAGIMQLNFTSNDTTVAREAIDSMIHFPDIFSLDENQQFPVVYFYLRAGDELAGASQVMKLAIYALKNARQFIEDEWKLGKHPTRPPVALACIDEWQLCADESIRNLLEQAAGLGIHLVLSNQDASQLRKPNCDLLPTVFENCGTKLIFTARSTDFQDMLMKASGEKTVHFASYQISHEDFARGKVAKEHAIQVLNDSWAAVNIVEQRAPRFERNDLIEMSNDPRRCIYFTPQASEIADYGGYPIMIDTDFFHSKPEYDRLAEMRWPAATPETIVPDEYAEKVSEQLEKNSQQFTGISMNVPDDGEWL